MGVMELGHICVHSLRWYPSKFGRAHFQSEIRQFGYLDSYTSRGKENCIFWQCQNSSSLSKPGS